MGLSTELRKAGGLKMRKAGLAVLVVFGLLSSGSSEAIDGRIEVAGGGPIVGIVQPEEASAAEKQATSELQHFLSVITGEELPIVRESERQGLDGGVIYVGRTKVGNGLIPSSGWGKETILVDAKSSNDIVITGGSDTAVLIATYRFLRDLGCRWLKPGKDGEYIPRCERIEVGSRRLVSSPDFAVRGWMAHYRYSLYLMGTSPARPRGPFPIPLEPIMDWGVRNGLNSMCHPASSDLGEKRGHGYVQRIGHTLSGLVPGNPGDPRFKELFEAHPEYFPLVDGKRVGTYKDGRPAQVCMSNPDVIKIAAQGVIKYLGEHPGTQRYQIGHNDEPSYWCECSKCLALDAPGSKWRKNDESDAYAPNNLQPSSPMGDRMIYFVNKVAEIVEKEFPDVYISTYAYGSTVSPPKRWRPRKNVMIEYANAALCFSHSMSDSSCPWNKLSTGWLKGWVEFGNPVVIYDYAQHPTRPDLSVTAIWLSGLADYIRFAKENGVYGWAGEGVGLWVGSALWFYVKAHLVWDADADLDELIADFCDHYYGAAGATMKAYYKLLDSAMVRYSGHIRGSMGYITPERMTKADQLFRRALEEAKSPAAQDHVRQARIAFLALRINRLEFWPKDPPLSKAEKKAHAEEYKNAREEACHLLLIAASSWPAGPGVPISGLFYGRVSSVYEPPPIEVTFGEVVKEFPIVWKFKTDPKDEGEKLGWHLTKDFDESWKSIRTDSSWTNQPYPGTYHGVAWYAIDFDALDIGQHKLWLLFGAIDGDAWFWLNGASAGKTTAPPSAAWDKPFALDITEKVKKGASNRLIVKVKKDRYAAGIWKPVKLVKATDVEDQE